MESVPLEPPKSIVVENNVAGLRLDHFLAAQFPDQSRSSLIKLIHSGHVLVNGRHVKAGQRLRTADIVDVVIPPPQPQLLVPEPVDFTVLYEDQQVLVVSKPAGVVVHPAAGHHGGTLVHGLLYRCAHLPAAAEDRPGIVHRLDKDTSGIMLVAKTEHALRALMADFKARKVSKTYHAILLGCPREDEGTVAAAIGRHPVDRKKMAIRPSHGKHAVTNWRILERFANGWCFAEIGIETGRTHQIRVHMASMQAPVAGDLVYGGEDRAGLLRPKRQMLHASTLCFNHPATGARLCLSSALPEDMEGLLLLLRGIHR